jgi:kumamolisin
MECSRRFHICGLGFLYACLSMIVTSTFTWAQADLAPRKTFEDSIVKLDAPRMLELNVNLMAMSPQVEKEEKSDQLELEFYLQSANEKLQSANEKELDALIARHQTISPEELKEKYSPSSADSQAVVDWLKSQGFEITRRTTNGIYAKASIALIEKSLKVRMVRVRSGGVTYDAAKTPPSMPADVGKNVLSIGGLQPFLSAEPQSILAPIEGFPPIGLQARAIVAPVVEKPPYLVSDLLRVYDANGVNLGGDGEKIAILIDTGPDVNDFNLFRARNNLPSFPGGFEIINVNGTALSSPSGEESLDVEWSTGIAPKAVARVYAAGSTQYKDLDKAIDAIIEDKASQPSMDQLSISLGSGEKYMPQGEAKAEHSRFRQLESLGVNIFVASGDGGSDPDKDGVYQKGNLQVEYESSDPDVTAVGGTSLTLDSSGNVANEIGWARSGGGISQVFSPRPAWQAGLKVFPDDWRLVPDVSSVADETRGAMIVLRGQSRKMSGTSWGAPVWAGMCALINEGRRKEGKPPLPFLAPLLYPLAGSHSFRDITAGSNGQYNAGPGYDLVTGLGVPDFKVLVQALK